MIYQDINEVFEHSVASMGPEGRNEAGRFLQVRSNDDDDDDNGVDDDGDGDDDDGGDDDDDDDDGK